MALGAALHVLEAFEHDGAGRRTSLRAGSQRFELPNALWLLDKGTSAATSWGPTLSTSGHHDATALATRRFTDAPPSTSTGQILLARHLQPSASALAPGEVRVDVSHDSVAVWGDALDLSRDPRRWAEAVPKARAHAGPQRALYAPGLGQPASYALYAYAGIDLFDSTPLQLAAAQGRFLTTDGAFEAAALGTPECPCQGCANNGPRQLDADALLAHNHYVANAELGRIRNALHQQRLRELVEARVRAHPELVALLRRLDEAYDYVEQGVPVHRSAPLWANSKESIQRVECERFRRRVRTRYEPPSSPRILLLLPCSARKPYSRSPSHRAMLDRVWSAGAAGLVHEVIVTSPLGIVPRELELTYPAAHYDVPVTGEWDLDEGAMIRTQLASLLEKREYDAVVSHLPKQTHSLVASLLPSTTIRTCEGSRATQPEALQRLELVLRKLGAQHEGASLHKLHGERLFCVASYQFGPEGAQALFAGSRTRGKWPTGKVLDEAGNQLAMLPTMRGALSLTMAGAKRLMDLEHVRVQIEDFPLTGSVFAAGVRHAHDDIRVGDEVLVMHGDQLRGVGVAQLTGREMTAMKRGEAVKVRHHG